MRPAALFLPALLGGAAAGILVADAGLMGGSSTVVLSIAAVVGALAAVPARSSAATLIAGLLLGAAVGVWRGGGSVLPTGPGSVVALVGDGEWELSGTITEEPRPRAERIQLVLDDVVARGDGAAPQPARGRLLLWLPRAYELVAGDRVAVTAQVDEPEDFDGFAYRAYLARQGIGGIARAYEAQVVAHSQGVAAELVAGLRRWLLDGLNDVVPEPEAALGAGILLGVRSGIAPEVSDAFSTAGLTHVVAISGWNIAIVAALVAAGLRPLGRSPGGHWLVPLLTVGVIAAYVALTGSTPSVVRAALMAGAMLLARLGGSRAHAAGALMLAALVMLLVAPPVLWDVGFQLSLLATAGLIWFGAGMERRLRWLPSAVREPIALTLAAQLTTLPVIVLNFERLSLIAPLANVLVVPIVPVVMLCCALAAPVGALDASVHLPLLGEAASWLTAGSAWLYLHLMIAIGKAAAAIPFASLPLSAPPWLALAWYPLLAIGWRRHADTESAPPDERPGPSEGRMPAVVRRLLRPSGLVLATVVGLGVVSFASLPDGRLHLIMLDVGQGDALLVRTPTGASMLVDGGPDPDLALARIGERLPFFERRIDVVLLTHPHQDHVAGLVEVLRRYRVRLVVDGGRSFDNPSYTRFLQLARAEPGGRLMLARAGEILALDSRTTFRLLYPSQGDAVGPLPDDDINNASIVGLLQNGEFTALLTGDAEAPVEARLAERGLLGPVDVLKVGHHGSRSSSSPPILRATQPAIALISAGVDNDYGHPSPVTLDALQAEGARVRRTDLEGSVEVVSDGRSYEVVSALARDGPRRARGFARLSDDAGSIGPWPFPDSITLARSSPASTFPRASWSTPRGCGASRPRRPGWSCRRASRSTSASSRSPPCCTTSTSPGLAPRESRTA